MHAYYFFFLGADEAFGVPFISYLAEATLYV